MVNEVYEWERNALENHGQNQVRGGEFELDSKQGKWHLWWWSLEVYY